jgi:hypothetical protein
MIGYGPVSKASMDILMASRDKRIMIATLTDGGVSVPLRKYTSFVITSIHSANDSPVYTYGMID